MPQEYFLASRDFEKFMDDLKRISMLQTTHQCYTMVEAVFRVFRGHVDIQTALDFASCLPPILRAIFVTDWDMTQPVTPFPDRRSLQAEVLALRHNHNLSTPSAIEDVGAALRLNMDPANFSRMLEKLSTDARDYWA